jgi:hypothetical protein
MRQYLFGLTILLFSICITGSARAQEARRSAAHGAEHPKESADHGAAKHDHDDDEEPPFNVEGGGKIAAGWTAKVDRDPLTKVRFESLPTGWHVRTAASVMLFRPADAISGNYRVTVTMSQTEGSPGHAEPHGLLLGGSALSGAAAKQRYTSFVVRGDGKFQIRRRADGRGTDVTNGSVDSKAVHQMDDKGRCTNELTVVVGATDVQFLVNGTEVHRAKRSDVDADGVVALRISHNLDLTISAFNLTKG